MSVKFAARAKIQIGYVHRATHDTFYLENIKSVHLLGLLRGTIRSRSTYNGIFEDVFLTGSHDTDIYRYLCMLATYSLFNKSEFSIFENY